MMIDAAALECGRNKGRYFDSANESLTRRDVVCAIMLDAAIVISSKWSVQVSSFWRICLKYRTIWQLLNTTGQKLRKNGGNRWLIGDIWRKRPLKEFIEVSVQIWVVKAVFWDRELCSSGSRRSVVKIPLYISIALCGHRFNCHDRRWQSQSRSQRLNKNGNMHQLES